MKLILLITVSLLSIQVLAAEEMHETCVLDKSKDTISVFDKDGKFLGEIPEEIEDLDGYLHDNCKNFTKVKHLFLPPDFSGKYSKSINSKNVMLEADASWDEIDVKQYAKDGSLEGQYTYTESIKKVSTKSVTAKEANGKKTYQCVYRLGYATINYNLIDIIEEVHSISVNYLDSFVCWRRSIRQILAISKLVKDRKISLSLTSFQDMILTIQETTHSDDKTKAVMTSSTALFRNKK